jgi:hypothetical protein
MSAREMLDMCVHYIALRHHMLTQEHVDILDEVWGFYEEYPPLPPSPPPERQVFREKHKREMIWQEIAELPPLAEPVKDKSEFLPSGAHLLPQDYQDFLYKWNKEIADTMGWWTDVTRDHYKKIYPEYWAHWVAQEEDFKARYPAQTRNFTEFQRQQQAREEWESRTSAPNGDTICYTHQVETCVCGTCGAARAFLNR